MLQGWGTCYRPVINQNTLKGGKQRDFLVIHVKHVIMNMEKTLNKKCRHLHKHSIIFVHLLLLHNCRVHFLKVKVRFGDWSTETTKYEKNK